jgi:hypothetical protein
MAAKIHAIAAVLDGFGYSAYLGVEFKDEGLHVRSLEQLQCTG